MDTIDLKIIGYLQDDGRITMKELGLRVGLTSPATIERVKKLEESGIIGGYKAIVNINRAGLPVRVFILLTAGDVPAGAVAEFAARHESILQCHRVAGGASHLLEGAMADMEGLERLLDELAPLGLAEPLLVLSSPVQHKAVVLP
jgi:Lrp/AsnC family transcriptional regulator, leucine-responsive regulatory protein